jgi:hypothetical protein
MLLDVLLSGLAHDPQSLYDFIVRDLFSQAGIGAGKVNECQIGAAFVYLVQHNGCALVPREACIVDHRKVVVADNEGAPLDA